MEDPCFMVRACFIIIITIIEIFMRQHFFSKGQVQTINLRKKTFAFASLSLDVWDLP